MIAADIYYLAPQIFMVICKKTYATGGGTRIKVNDTTYTVRHIKVISGSHINFAHFAEVGDTIIKRQYSDTLILIKEKKGRFYFKFEHSQ